MKDWILKKTLPKKSKESNKGKFRKTKLKNELYYKAGDRHGFGAATLLGISLLAMTNWPITKERWAYLFIAAIGVTHLVWGRNLKKLADKDKSK